VILHTLIHNFPQMESSFLIVLYFIAGLRPGDDLLPDPDPLGTKQGVASIQFVNHREGPT